MDSLQARMGNAAHEEAAEVPHEARRYVSPHPVVEQKKSKKPRFPKWLMPVIAAVVAVGVVAFIALWALVALGPQLSGGTDGGGHAPSNRPGAVQPRW